MMSAEDRSLLRRTILSVCIEEQVDVLPHDDGLLVHDAPVRLSSASQRGDQGDEHGQGRPARPILVRWSQLADTCGPYSPDSPAGRRRSSILLRLAGALAALGPAAASSALRDAVRVMALPNAHVDHLGPSWAVEAVRGGALWIGPAVTLVSTTQVPTTPTAAIPTDTTPGISGPPSPLPLPSSLLRAAGVRLDDCWPAAALRAARASATAAEMLNRDGAQAGLLLPVAGHDVLTQLAYPALRAGLAGGDRVGMRSVAVPQRSRGWWDLSRIDPYYVPLAWRACESSERGLAMPLLVTREEVVAVRLRSRQPAFG
jgi:hypothetical protein